jgi:2-oxoglutarate ferredoxin oxidoreductase subunit beta
LDGKGLSIVEVLSTCSTQWVMSPLEAMKHVDTVMAAYYPLGVYKDGNG